MATEYEISALLGVTLLRVEQIGHDRIEFDATDGRRWAMYHRQDCCESVSINDISGSLSDLVDSPILKAEESASGENPPGVGDMGYQDSFTWTFYHLATVNGYVTIRWYGESNGCYSESVSFEPVDTVEFVN